MLLRRACAVYPYPHGVLAHLAQREAAVGVAGRDLAGRVAQHAGWHDAVLLAQHIHQANLPQCAHRDCQAR